MACSLPARVALILFALASPVAAAPKPPRVAVLSEAELATRIDRYIAQRLAARKVPPAPLIDDAAFLRRAYLDLAGRIPGILEVRDFLDDDRPARRRRWIDRLLHGIKKNGHGNSYAEHFASVWRHWLVPPAGNEEGNNPGPAFEGWLRKQFQDNVPYDRLVRTILTAPGSSEDGASAFYLANENKPENLAAATARRFLGLKLECARCHDDRSGGNWSREQFWELAAFFSDLPQADGKPGARLAIAIPNTRIKVKAGFPDNTRPVATKDSNPRTLLANWITAPANPHFARATVNRVWASLFGTGLVEPIDERGDHNPPSHPKLLDELARQFILHKFDLKYLLRSLVLSKTYQRGSVLSHRGQIDPRLFARMTVRGLSAAQLFDSLAVATEYKNGSAQPFGSNREQTPRDAFMARFLSQEKKTELHTSILQALHLMNGPLMRHATSPTLNRTLASIADAGGISTVRRLETLYLVVLTRKPTAVERKRLVPYLDRGGPTGNRRKALADVYWALLNCAEFYLNH